MFIDSGGVTEYCKDYGTIYTFKTLESKLKFVMENYKNLLSKISSYPNNSERMSEEFLDLFKKMLIEKDEILKTRSLGQNTRLQTIIYLTKKFLFKFLKY